MNVEVSFCFISSFSIFHSFFDFIIHHSYFCIYSDFAGEQILHEARFDFSKVPYCSPLGFNSCFDARHRGDTGPLFTHIWQWNSQFDELANVQVLLTAANKKSIQF